LGRLKEYERLIITQTLETHGNSVPGKKQAAKELGISLPTLYRRIKELGI
jgi:transcriptional regulator with PAS, ATPase and Fis domain